MSNIKEGHCNPRVQCTFVHISINLLISFQDLLLTKPKARSGQMQFAPRARARLWDLGNGAIMLQKLFNPEWQITSKSFLLSSFLINFSFSPTVEISRLELEFEESLPRKTASIFKEGLDRSQMEQPIKKNKFSYFARSRLRLHPQEIWERDYQPTCMAAVLCDSTLVVMHTHPLAIPLAVIAMRKSIHKFCFLSYYLRVRTCSSTINQNLEQYLIL